MTGHSQSSFEVEKLYDTVMGNFLVNSSDTQSANYQYLCVCMERCVWCFYVYIYIYVSMK